MVNDLKPKTMAWFSCTLIGAIVALALLMMHASTIDAALPIVFDVIGGGAGLAALYVLCNAWHKVSTKHLERKSIKLEIARSNSEQLTCMRLTSAVLILSLHAFN